jgi:dienelactone hydrolase
VYRTLAATGLLTASLLAAAPASVNAHTTAAVALPRPTGPYAVGTVALHLVDRSRPDPWLPAVPYRELMVSVYYPAREAGRYPVAPYMLPGAAAHFDGYATGLLPGLAPGAVNWAGVRTHAHLGAPVDRRGRLPVVLYSPGLGDPRSLGTAFAEEAASRGYLVVSVDHTYEASEVEFPGGRVAPISLPTPTPDNIVALRRVALAARVADTRFVLDQVGALAAGRNPDADHRALPRGLAGAPDPGRIGMVGHSAGGFTALQAMHDDPRIRAAADLDGTLEYSDEDGTDLSTVARDGVRRPFLLMGIPGDDHYVLPSWRALWQHSTGPRADVTLPGSAHHSFTDLEALLPQLAAVPPATVADAIGTVDPRRALAVQRRALGAFLDRHVRGAGPGR